MRFRSGRFVFKSIKEKIIFFFVLVLSCGLILMTFFSFSLMKVNLEGYLEDTLVNDVNEEAQDFEKYLALLVQQTKQIAKNGQVVNSLVNRNVPSEDLNILLEGFKLKSLMDDISIYDVSGEVIKNDPEKGVIKEDLLRSVLARGEERLFFYDDKIFIVCPIIFHNKTLGAIAVSFRLKDCVEKGIHIDETQALWLMRNNSVIFQLNVHKGIAYKTARASNVGLDSYLKQLKIVVKLGVNNYHYFNKVNKAVVNLLVLAFTIILLSIIFAFRLGNSLSKPVLELALRVRASEKHPEVRCSPLGTHDELDMLANIFDERTSQLIAIKQNLEELVDKRTKDLNIINDQLLIQAGHLKEALKAAQQSSIAKGNFLANMSHEIRTPMNAIIGLTDLVLETELNDKQYDYLNKIKISSMILLGLINDILDFSKIEAGKLSLEKVNFNIQMVVDSVRSILSDSAKIKGLSLDFRVGKNVPLFLKGDPGRLTQILVNLTSNAIKFTSEGRVLIELEYQGIKDDLEMIRFSVEDTGIGMTTGQIKRVFEKFSQADDSTTRKYGGTGLGLAISKQLVELMGGTLQVSSMPDLGSSFYFTVALEPGEEHVEKNDESRYDLSMLKGIKVLLVEDNDINRQVACEKLEKYGVIVDIAVNGQEAVNRIQEKDHYYDVVLMDIQMPIMDGLEATRVVREKESLEGGKRLPIIAMTASAMVADVEKCKEAGMDDHVPKPIDTNLLNRTILRLLDSRQRFDNKGDDSRSNSASVIITTKEQESNSMSGVLQGVYKTIDTVQGIRNLDGNKKLYFKLLDKFKTDYEGYGTVVKNDLNVKQFDEAKRNVHSIKGIAANLGAKPLFIAAAALEKSIASDPEEDHGVKLDDFAEQLDLLFKDLSFLEKSSSEESPEKEIDYYQLVHMLKELQELLKRNDFKALSFFSELKNTVTLFDSEASENISQALENFVFSDALDYIENLMVKLEKSVSR